METLTTQQNEDSFPITWMNQLSDWISNNYAGSTIGSTEPGESDAEERVSDIDRLTLLVEVIWVHTQLKKSLIADKNTL
jgi:hypothetical protein